MLPDRTYRHPRRTRQAVAKALYVQSSAGIARSVKLIILCLTSWAGLLSYSIYARISENAYQPATSAKAWFTPAGKAAVTSPSDSRAITVGNGCRCVVWRVHWCCKQTVSGCAEGLSDGENKLSRHRTFVLCQTSFDNGHRRFRREQRRDTSALP